MPRELGFYLWDIDSAISDILIFTAGLTVEQYMDNRLVQRAVERSFEIVGEALKQAQANFPGKLNALPDYSLAVRFRDRLAHGYFTVRQELVWQIIREELPSLHEAVRALLKDNPAN